MATQEEVNAARQQVQESFAALQAATEQHQADVEIFNKAETDLANNSLIDALIVEANANDGVSPVTGETVEQLNARRPK